MRRFSLFRRGKYWYARFWNPAKQGYAGAISTGERSKNPALATVALWDREGVPKKRNKPGREILEIDSLMHAARHVPFDEAATKRLCSILIERGLIDGYTLPSTGADAEPLLGFSRRFWDFDQSE